MDTSSCLFSGLSRYSRVPFGSLEKASSVGANTVKGPSPLRVLTRSPAWSAAAKVLKFPALTAVSTRSFLQGAAKIDEVSSRIDNVDSSFILVIILVVVI